MIEQGTRAGGSARKRRLHSPAPEPGRTPCAGLRGRAHRRRGQSGQTLVEFAMSLMVFMLVTVGLLDGLRVIFYYSQIQEGAREGARWGAVQVAREVNGSTPWGTFGDMGNTSATYCDSGAICDAGLSDSRKLPDGTTNTIVGATTLGLTAVDLSTATVQIDTPIDPAATEESQTDPSLTNEPITVTVTYPFRPILGMVFGGVTINLKGSSSMLHE